MIYTSVRKPLVALLFSASLLACGGDDSTDDGTDAAIGTDAAVAHDAAAHDASTVLDAASAQDAATGADATLGVDASSADTGVASDAATDSGVDAGAAADAGTSAACTTYCTTIMANCTAGNAQYPSLDSCVHSCAAFPVGMATDQTGNTLGCHTYHAGAAAGGGAAVHCQHAGPSGASVCGTLCEGFCAIQAVACVGNNQQFASANACMTACSSFAHGSGAYNTGFTSGNTDYCRVYHLSVAASSVADSNTHCPHIVVNSPTCQ